MIGARPRRKLLARWNFAKMGKNHLPARAPGRRFRPCCGPPHRLHTAGAHDECAYRIPMKNKNYSDWVVALAVVACSAVLFAALALALSGTMLTKPGSSLRVNFHDVTGIN